MGVDEKFKTKTFTMYPNPLKRIESLDELVLCAADLPLTQSFHFVLRKGQENRLDIANRIYQVAIGQVVNQHADYDDPAVVAGISKFHLLLPFKATWAAELETEEEGSGALLAEEAGFERTLCDMIASSPMFDDSNAEDEEHRQAIQQDMYRAYDRAIRSKTLITKHFAQYFDRFLNVWTKKGVGFVFRPGERERALGNGR